jgi:flagellar M-ring protein FliF
VSRSRPDRQPAVAQSGATRGLPGAKPARRPNNADTPWSRSGLHVAQSTRNYEIDRTMAYTKAPAGKVTRLSVAVLIDNLRTTDKDGKVTETPLPPEQIERLTRSCAMPWASTPTAATRSTS